MLSISVCSNLSEGWRKRRYKAVFLNKLTDSGQESAETQTWLEFSLHCIYISQGNVIMLKSKSILWKSTYGQTHLGDSASPGRFNWIIQCLARDACDRRTVSVNLRSIFQDDLAGGRASRSTTSSSVRHSCGTGHQKGEGQADESSLHPGGQSNGKQLLTFIGVVGIYLTVWAP